MKYLWITVIAAIMLSIVVIAPAADTKPSADLSAASKYLKELVHPPTQKPEFRNKVLKLISDLGNNDWNVRNSAFEELKQIGSRAEHLVSNASAGRDAEASARVRQLLKLYRQEHGTRATAAIDLLATAKDKRVIDHMLALMEHESWNVRYAAEYGLRRVTGRVFGFNAYAMPDKRHVATDKWIAWWKDARANYDFKPADHKPYGIFCCDIATRQVSLIDLKGKIIWSRPVAWHPYSADILPNGHILVSSYMRGVGCIEELDRRNKIVWNVSESLSSGPVRNVRRLSNGNTLAIDLKGRRVIEISASGKKIVWQKPYAGSSTSVLQRLPNGNTLLSSYNQPVQEIDSSGAVIWTKDLGPIYDARKLINGNILIVNRKTRTVSELATEGTDIFSKTVWEWNCVDSSVCPRKACRLEDGRTLVVATGTNIFLVDTDGRSTEIRKKQRGYYYDIRIVPAWAKNGCLQSR